MGREVGWDGIYNARDLGGLPTRDGASTRFGAYIRSGDLRFVTEAGWRAALDGNLRTVVDLRNNDEHAGEIPPGVTRVEVPLDDIDDVEFWQRMNDEGRNGTAGYFRPFLEEKSVRCAAAVTALARAAPSTLFHCGAGRDRTGLVALLLLGLADVTPEAIVADYTLSFEGVRSIFDPDDEAPATLLDVLDGFEAEEYLLAAGVAADDLAEIRRRLRG